MSLSAEHISQILLAMPQCAAADCEARVPSVPGYYAIFVDKPDSLPQPYSEILKRRNSKLIYAGIATVSLRKRLLEQDLRQKGASTFFRGIAPILGYRPEPESLSGKKNQRNYVFGLSDMCAIINWIDTHLLITWAEVSPASPGVEQYFISTNRPLLNSSHNPERLEALARLREECRRIATTTVA